MQADLPVVILIIFVAICIVLPFLVVVTLLFTISIKSRLKERQHILNDLQRMSTGNIEPPPLATRLLAGFYIIISLAVLGALTFTAVTVLAYYLGFPLTNNIDVKSLGVISLAVLLIAMITTIILAIVSKRIYKLKQ